MIFESRIETEFNEALFSKCFDDAADSIVQNFPTEDSYGGKVTAEDHKNRLRARYKTAFTSPGRFVLSLWDSETGDILNYAMHTFHGTSVVIDVVMYAKDANGSKAWVYDYFADDTHRANMESLGAENWYSKIYSQPLITFLSAKYPAVEARGLDVSLSTGKRPDFITIKSTWGWTDKPLPKNPVNKSSDFISVLGHKKDKYS